MPAASRGKKSLDAGRHGGYITAVTRRKKAAGKELEVQLSAVGGLGNVSRHEIDGSFNSLRSGR